ncbi:class I glutamine amidotransferase-like protein [Parachaetomium inaequale]|uniref:Class I glutamine amidotransferase-like protein n=1 Tax=Parachaetomium inaequale TaxID=2588326 RepID=A0AAN6PHB3_9PEZI|nr:class I glutamine amidotransferase-like protein [Parachaetomium inaequale]
MASSVPKTPRRLRIGVMMDEVQLSDIMGIDIFGNLSQEYMAKVQVFEPKWGAIEHHAAPMEFFYIATTLEPANLTPDGLRFVPNVTYDDCPRDLDIVIVGGPLWTHRPAQADRFMKEAWLKTRVWLTTCIGSMWLASSGVLGGLKCTTNREGLEAAKKMHPEVEWLDQRWVVEEKPFDGEGKGELWTAGGAGAGINMIATYCLENFDKDFVNTLALRPLEFRLDGNMSQFYLA